MKREAIVMHPATYASLTPAAQHRIKAPVLLDWSAWQHGVFWHPITTAPYPEPRSRSHPEAWARLTANGSRPAEGSEALPGPDSGRHGGV